MKGKHYIDDYFKSKLGSHQSESPSHLWANIASQIKEEKPKKPFALYYKMGGLMILLIAILLGGINLFDNQTSTSAPLATKQEKALHNFAEKSNEHSAKEMQLSKQAVEPTSESVSSKKITKQKTIASNIETSTPTNTIKINNSASLNVNAITQDDNIDGAGRNVSSVLYSPENLTANKSIEPITTFSASLQESPKLTNTNQTTFSRLTANNLSGVHPVNYDDNPLGLKIKRFRKKKRDCYDFSEHAAKFYVDALVSADFVSKVMDVNDNDATKYLEERRTTEKVQTSFSSGVRFSYLTRQGISIRSGLMYAQINEQLNYVNENERRETIIEIRDPDTQAIIDRDTIVQIGSRILKTENQYKFVDIPFMVGYEFHKNKLALNVNAGAFLNLYFAQKGEILSENLTPVSIDPSDPNSISPFKDQVGVSLYGSIALAYKVAPSFQILFEPYYKHTMQSVTKSDYAISQQYDVYGLTCGLRYKF